MLKDIESGEGREIRRKQKNVPETRTIDFSQTDQALLISNREIPCVCSYILVQTKKPHRILNITSLDTTKVSRTKRQTNHERVRAKCICNIMILPLKLIRTDNKKRANIEFEIVRSNFTQPGASPAKKNNGLNDARRKGAKKEIRCT